MTTTIIARLAPAVAAEMLGYTDDNAPLTNIWDEAIDTRSPNYQGEDVDFGDEIDYGYLDYCERADFAREVEESVHFAADAPIDAWHVGNMFFRAYKDLYRMQNIITAQTFSNHGYMRPLSIVELCYVSIIG